MHELIRFLLVGFVSGWIGAILARGSVRLRGCLTYTVIGMLGAILGGYGFRFLNQSEVGAVLAATGGAIVLLSAIRSVRKR